MIEVEVVKRDLQVNWFPIDIYIDGEKKGVIDVKHRTQINVEKGIHRLKLQHKIPFFSAEKTIEVEEQTVITFHKRSDKWLYLCLFIGIFVFIHTILSLHWIALWFLSIMLFLPLIIGICEDFINRKNFYIIKTKQKKNK